MVRRKTVDDWGREGKKKKKRGRKIMAEGEEQRMIPRRSVQNSVKTMDDEGD